MKTGNVMPLTQVFVSISEPRSARHKRHDLAELLTSGQDALRHFGQGVIDLCSQPSAR
jgi:hypothetical protein